MTNTTTKRALLSGVFALVLCFAMLLGTTFAWFTDSVVSGSNVIQSGNLDIDVEYTLDGENWAKLDNASDLFQLGLWEPGHTEVVALKITNNGSLDLNYIAKLNVVNETLGKTADGEDIVLSDHLQIAAFTHQANQFGDILLGMVFGSRDGGMWGDASNLKGSTLVSSDFLSAEEDNAHYAFIKVFMPETVGNEANHDGVNIPSIEFGIDVLATQRMSESDSFGNDYDSFATIDSEQELLAALEADYDLLVIGSDFAITETVVIPAGKEVAVDLAGRTVSQVADFSASYDMIVNEGALTILDSVGGGKLSLTNTNATGGESSWAVYTIANRGGELVVNSGTIENLSAQDGNANNAIFHYAGNTTVNGGYISAPYSRSLRQWQGEVTINGGSFEGQVWVQATIDDCVTTVNGGSFKPATFGGDSSSIFLTNDTNEITFKMTDGSVATKIGATIPAKIAKTVSGGTFANFGILETGYLTDDADITIKLVDDIDAGTVATLASIPAVKNVTLDLNGCDITATLDNDGWSQLFRINKGATFTVEGEGNVHVIADQTMSYGSVIFNNDAGNLVINGGTYTMEYGTYDEGYLLPSIVDTNSNIGKATTTINGGTFYHTRNMFRNYAQPQRGENNATLIINGGTFNGEADDYASIWNQKTNANGVVGDGVVVLNGGTFNYIQIDNDFADDSCITLATGINVQIYH